MRESIAGDNDATLVVAQVEHIDAVPNIDEIVGVPGVSAVFIGPFDLSASFGKPGEIDAPEVRKAMSVFASACAARSLPCGLFLGGGEAARRAFDEGYSLVCAATDTLLLGEAAGRLRADARGRERPWLRSTTRGSCAPRSTRPARGRGRRGPGRRRRRDRRDGGGRRLQPADRQPRPDGARRDRRHPRGAARVGNYRLTGSTLYVTVEPCLMCVGAMVHARIGTLVFGALEPKSGAVESALRAHEVARPQPHVRCRAGVLADECREIIQAFFRERR